MHEFEKKESVFFNTLGSIMYLFHTRNKNIFLQSDNIPKSGTSLTQPE